MRVMKNSYEIPSVNESKYEKPDKKPKINKKRIKEIMKKITSSKTRKLLQKIKVNI